MKRLQPDKLHVERGPQVTMTEPVIGRKYTLTHLDQTADLFLTISSQFAYDKVNSMRDEVLAEWRIHHGWPYLYVYVYVDGQGGAAVRDAIFRRELPLALQAIRYGDQTLFANYPQLDNAPIWIHFDSIDPTYHRFENWGTLQTFGLGKVI